MPTRAEVIQGFRSHDEFQDRDIAQILDYLEQVFGTSDQAARDNALTSRKSRTLDAVTNRDVEAIYNYAAALGTPMVTFQQFLAALPNIQKDNISREFIGKLLDLVDESFTYDLLILGDMGAVAGIFYSLTDGVLLTPTDEGPTGNVGLTNAGGAGQSLDPDPPWPGVIASLDTTHRYADGTFSFGAFGPSEPGTLEGWFRMDAIAGTDHLIEGSGGGKLVFVATTSGDIRILLQAVDPVDPGAWVTVTAYAQGDRVRLISDAGARSNECEVAGTSDVGEPAFPTDGSTVADGTVTWRDLGPRSTYHNLDLTGVFNPTVGEWFHIVVVREATGDWVTYINGVEDSRLTVAADDTTPGSFGGEKIGDFVADYSMDEFNIGDNGGFEDELNGSWTKVAAYTQALTAAQVLAHYDKGVALGFTP